MGEIDDKQIISQIFSGNCDKCYKEKSMSPNKYVKETQLARKGDVRRP